ncbi:MAG: hypothetical protein JWM56_27 [Candidatus Peribacteria bacterium]|nr:hypothetical protein [Candidatus Peribacteria bacterium]
MHIVFTRFPLESAFGGAEIQTLSLMDGLMSRGHTLTFIGSCPVLLAECGKRNMQTVPLDIGPPPVTIMRSLTLPLWRSGAKQKLIAAMRALPAVDTVCMLSVTEKLLLTDWADAQKMNVVWIEHDRVGRWLRHNPWLNQLKTASAKASTVTVSELSRKIYLELGWPPERTTAIPNGIDPARVSAAAHTDDTIRRPVAGTLHLGCIARLSEEKGIDILLNAIADMPDVTLDIVGRGRQEKLLKAMAERMHNGESVPRIRFLPSVGNPSAFYRSVDALVLPSRDHDPFGLVVAEAMSAGVPVIVTDQCGIASYLTPGTDALIVPANSVPALSEAISQMKAPQVREELGRHGKETALAIFSVGSMVDAYEKLMQN